MSAFRRQRSVVCQELVELVSDYLDGNLQLRERAAVQAHLVQCDGCAGYVAQVERMLELTAQADGDGPALPNSLIDTLLIRYRQTR